MAIKKIFLAIFISLSIFLPITSANYNYNITVICNEGVCVSKEKATWEVELFNDGKKDAEYTAIQLYDTFNNSLVASLEIPYDSSKVPRGYPIVVKPGEKASVNISAELPFPTSWQSLIFYPCFRTVITDSYIIGKTGKYETTKCYNDNHSISLFECVKNENCNQDESCIFSKCKKLSCEDCQYSRNHSCFSYECCSSDQCRQNEKCDNNICILLNCSETETILNNTCLALECKDDEHIVNSSCVKLDCAFDEFALNSSCQRLNCTESQYILNHTCKELNCKENEQFKNHTCQGLSCMSNETFFNHTCIALDCTFYQDAKSHSCFNNNKMIILFSLEVLAVVLIILFLFIDLKKIFIKK